MSMRRATSLATPDTTAEDLKRFTRPARVLTAVQIDRHPVLKVLGPRADGESETRGQFLAARTETDQHDRPKELEGSGCWS